MRVCDRCGQERSNSEFAPRGRGLSKTCKACVGAPVASPAAQVTEPVPVPSAELVMPGGGLGFRAAYRQGQFLIEQDKSDDEGTWTHKIDLLPHEAGRLVDWLADQVRAREKA